MCYACLCVCAVKPYVYIFAVCLHMHMCTCVYVHTVYVHNCTCVYAYMCTCVHVYMCMCADEKHVSKIRSLLSGQSNTHPVLILLIRGGLFLSSLFRFKATDATRLRAECKRLVEGLAQRGNLPRQHHTPPHAIPIPP